MTRSRALLLASSLLLAACVDEPDDGTVAFRCLSGGAAGLIGLEKASISGNPVIAGAYPSVFSNVEVSLAGSYTILGKAMSGGTVTNSGNGAPVQGVVENAGTIAVSDPTAEVAAAKTTNDNAKIPCVKQGTKCKSPVVNGVLTLSGQSSLTLPAGSYYLQGISMSGQTQLHVSGAVVIYLAGGATFNGGSAANPLSDSLRLVSSSTQDVKINGGGTTAMHIFAPKATVRFAGSNGFRGSAIGRELHVSGNASLEITQDLAVTSGTTTCTPPPQPEPAETSAAATTDAESTGGETTMLPDETPGEPLPDLAR